MSFTIIEDGAGTGRKVKVNSNNKLEVNSISSPTIADKSSEGEGFRIVTDYINIPAATKMCVLHVKNTSVDKSLHIQAFVISWDGGSTTYNKPIYAWLNGGTSDPTANHTAAAVNNLNSGSTKTFEITAYKWDEVGSGMTVASDGGVGGTGIFSQGMTINANQGAVVIAPSKTSAIFVEAVEAGKFGVILEGYTRGEDE